MDNKEKPSSIIYSPEINNIYILQEDFEYVSIIDAKNISPTFPDIPEPEILEIDSVKKVSGIPCKTLKLRWNNMGEEWYFYNEETAIINPSLYKHHSYEYFNEIIKSTGAYPLEIIKSFNDMIAIRMTLISIEELQLSDEVFAIPELKKANKKMTNLPEKLLGSKVMKIKN
ncbi:hypothetical protein [Flexithrix dorotheae]|uniref:hypothetical protein n=1 Tax=Flexithrix dorotheae TaxID=70993 RepID=UPI0012F84507|nr:hypothetical protein [Flexithrix dorotheae]